MINFLNTDLLKSSIYKNILLITVQYLKTAHALLWAAQYIVMPLEKK
jgi:hypothetical protein